MPLFYHHEENLEDLQEYMKNELEKMEMLIKGVGEPQDKKVVNKMLESLEDTKLFFRVSLKWLNKKISKDEED